MPYLRRAYRFLPAISLLIVLLMLLGACGGSRTQEAPPPAAEVLTDTPVPAAEATETEATETEATETEATETEATETEATPTVSEEMPAEEASATEPAPAAGQVGAGSTAFAIDAARSEARFLIDEVLLGADKTVVGVTSLITGTLRVDPANPTAAEIGPIEINARDLTTDSSRRNRSIQREILLSALDANKFITFLPTAIEGIPEAIAVGEPFEFRVTGDLTVRGVTQPVTFAMTVTPNSPTEIQGSGRATVLHEDFGIRIPNVPIVANVADEVRLEIDFVAVPLE